MAPLLWAGLVGGAMGAGASLALLLVVVRPREALVALGGIVSMGFAVVAGSRLVAAYDTTTFTVVAGLLAVAGLGGGFALVSAVLSYVAPRAPRARIPLPGISVRTLAVLLVDTESETYRPSETTREIAELVAAGLPEPSIAITPFHYAAQKARYRAVGGRSPEHAAARACAENVECRLASSRFAGPVTVRCSEPSALLDLVEQALDAGYTRAIVAGAHIAQSSRAVTQRRDLEEAGDLLASISVGFTRPLWTSDELARLIAERTLAVADGPSDSGVVLLVHGQPGLQADSNPTFDIQENAFANRVRTLLQEGGLDEANIRVCAAEWRDPGIAETVRHLAALGSRRIIVVPTCLPFANLQVLLDVPAAARDARVPDDVRIVHVAPWGEDEVFSEVIAREIELEAGTRAS